MNHKLLPAGLLALALAHSVHAVDMHPLESRELAAGVHVFDNIIIPAGVTLTFVGEPMEMILRAEHDIRIDGNLIGPGWNLALEAGESLVLNTGGLLEFAAGSIVLIGHAMLPGDCVAGYCDASRVTTTPPPTATELGAIRGGEITIRTRSDTQIKAGPIAIDAGNFTTLNGPAPAVPEPETWALLLAGLGLVGWQARRGR